MTVRIRKKPPEAMPAGNAGKPWSELDLDDLRHELRRGAPLPQIAELLGREITEVEAKIEELTAQHRP